MKRDSDRTRAWLREAAKKVRNHVLRGKMRDL